MSPPASPANSRPSSPTFGGPGASIGRGGVGYFGSGASPLTSPPVTPGPMQRALDSAMDLLSPGAEPVSAFDDHAVNDLLTECHYYAFAENGIGNALDSL